MKEKEAQFIDVSELRVGLYVYLDLGWMDHPFALNSFRIGSQEQIDTIRGLGIERIRYSPEQSTAAPVAVAAGPQSAATTTAAATAAAPDAAPPGPGGATGDGGDTPAAAGDTAASAVAPATEEEAAAEARQQRRAQLSAQRASLQRCENRFAEATQSYRQAVEAARSRPVEARQQCEAVVDALLDEMGQQEESCIRLLSEKSGEKTSLHTINVTVISLLLGQALDFDAEQMRHLGTGALLHDLGKLDLPDRLRWRDDHFSSAERQIFRQHVGNGVTLAQQMGLDKDVQLIIAQHHEHDDGSGYPLKLAGEQISAPARVVALVNHYDNLCNPGNPALAVTPHEALSLIYAQAKRHFDARTLALFIRMMGVYPPGSVVELSDGRYAMVVSVNSSRPLRPHIVVHDAAVPFDEALIVDLEHAPALGIRRSLRPLQLPRAAFDYLSPRKRLCYFFERGRDPSGIEAPMPTPQDAAGRVAA